MTTANDVLPRKLPLLVSLLLLVPGVGLAARESAPGPEWLPGTSAPAPLHLVEASREAEPIQRIHPVMRVAAELGAMALTSFGVGAAGFFVGGALCDELAHDNRGYYRCLTPALHGFAAGVTLGAPLGVWWGGKLVRGRGTLLGAMLGAGAAALAGAVTAQLITSDDFTALFVPLSSLVGSVVGYELSHGANAPPLRAASASVQPVLAVSGKSAALGLSGRF